LNPVDGLKVTIAAALLPVAGSSDIDGARRNRDR